MSSPNPADTTAKTVWDVLERRVQCTPQRHAFFVMTPDAQWQPLSWASYAERVERLATALTAAGVVRGDRLAICARTSLDWEIAQMAGLRSGASVVGLDTDYSDELLAALIVQLSIAVFIAQDGATLARIPPSLSRRFKLVLTMDETHTDSSSVRSLHALISAGIAGVPLPAAPSPNDEAVVVFSSGTTGLPKPVAYRHDQVSLAIRSIVETYADIQEGSVLVCWLPLANLFQRMINFAAMARGATSYVVGDPRSVMDHIGAANPHVFIGVPRFFEKLHAGVTSRIEAHAGLSARFARWAMRIGQRRARALRSHERPALSVRLLWPVANRLVLRRIRAAFGANLRYFISGSAPMPLWLLEWFDGIGLPVLEAYGVSECIVPIAANRYDARKLGTVGRPIPGQTVTLADDGEVLVRGAGVALRETRLDGDVDFLATGDIGQFDADGFLRITGRKADAFKTSGGKWVAPAEIEGRLRRLPYIEHAVVMAAGGNAIVALIGVTTTGASGALPDPGKNDDEATEDAESRRHRQLRDDVATALTGLPAHQRPCGLLIVPAKTFSIAGGELTTNLKLRRKQIEAKLATAIDRLRIAIDQARPAQPAQLPFVIIDMAGPAR